MRYPIYLRWSEEDHAWIAAPRERAIGVGQLLASYRGPADSPAPVRISGRSA